MLFLLSLAVACLLWFGLARQRQGNVSVQVIRAPLKLVNLPRELVVTSPVPDTVSVQLRGPRNALDRSLEVWLDMSDARPGTTSYTIGEDALALPEEVELVSVDPASIDVAIERMVIRTVPVRPDIEGEPAPGFEIVQVRVTPPQIMVQGAESRMDDLEALTTAPVSVEGATGPLETAVQPQIPDDRPVRLLTLGPVTVTVEVRQSVTPTPVPQDDGA
jgi:YbbR domain-containing protein